MEECCSLSNSLTRTTNIYQEPVMSKALAEGTTLYIFSELGMFFMLSISFIDKHLEVSSLCKTLGKMESSGGCRERGRLRIQTLETGHLGVGLTFTFTVFLGNDLEHLGPQSFYFYNGDNATPRGRLVRIKCVSVHGVLRSGTGHPSAV